MNTVNTHATAQHKSNSIMGHPEGLLVLFFTEMWERFSYYGMRSLLVLYLITATTKGGWGWDRADALNLYGSYTFWVYITGVLGGYISDRVLGARKAVIIGGFIIAAGHVCMTLETTATFYLGLTLIVTGTGLFKPNVSNLVGQLYDKSVEESKKRDAGFTLFYMGINSGAFFGTALCGYIGEKISWPYGFGLAGFFMILGSLQFYFSQNILGNIGGIENEEAITPTEVEEHAHIVRDRLMTIGIFSAFTIFFWMAFEQAGGTMTIFAADYTNRTLQGTAGFIFNVFNTLLLVVPTIVLTGVLFTLLRATAKRYPLSNVLLVICFTAIWGLLIWMLTREFETDQSEIAATWFSILNSFFIIILAPLFSILWRDYWQPSGPIKFAVGLILLGLGFGVLAYGAADIPSGAKTASVSAIWLVLAYLLHTMGELCLSPVGMSYVSKLSPHRLLGLMFGVWFIMYGIANKIAGMTGSLIDTVSAAHSISFFFLIFTFLPIGAGLAMLLMNRWMIRKMHGIV